MTCDMEAGHGGPSGRLKRYKETAKEYAFMLDRPGSRSEDYPVSEVEYDVECQTVSFRHFMRDWQLSSVIRHSRVSCPWMRPDETYDPHRRMQKMQLWLAGCFSLLPLFLVRKTWMR